MNVKYLKNECFGALAAISIISFSLSSAVTVFSQEWRHNGPWNANITSLKVHPQNDSILFCGTSARGIWKSSNGGESWLECCDGLPINPDTSSYSYILPWYDGDYAKINFIETSPAPPHRIWAGTEQGLFYSDNTGESWSESVNGLPPVVNHTKFLICQDSTNVLFTGTSSLYVTGTGLFRSMDSGESWELLIPESGSDLVCVSELKANPNDPTRLYADFQGGSSEYYLGLYYSDNRGQSWTTLDSTTYHDFIDLHVDPNDDDHLYSVAQNGYMIINMMESFNGGYDWSYYSPMSSPIFGLYADTNNLIAIPESTDSLCVSNNFGDTWNIIGIDFPLPSFMNRLHICHNTDYSYYYFGNNWTLVKTTPSFSNFEEIDHTIDNSYIQTIECSQTDPNILYAGGEGLWKSIDNGESWIQLAYMEIEDIAVHPANSDTILVAGPSLFISYDGGVTLNECVYYGFGNFTSIDFDSYNPDLIFATNTTNFYKSTDGGEFWQALAPSTHEDYNYILFDPEHEGHVYLCGDYVYKSIDWGLSWEQISYRHYPKHITFQPNSDRFAYCNGYYMYISDENGENIQFFTDNLPSSRILKCEFNPTIPTQLLITTPDGIFVTEDLGETWNHLEGPYNQRSTDIAWSWDHTTIHISTHGYGVWSAASTVLSVDPSEKNEILPNEPIVLYSPYPNPTNSEAIIELENKIAANYSVNIYNILGQKVYTIHQGFLEAGFHKWTWKPDSSELKSQSSGIYYIQLRGPDTIQSKKLVLIH